jgi:hypothetical protein
VMSALSPGDTETAELSEPSDEVSVTLLLP